MKVKVNRLALAAAFRRLVPALGQNPVVLTGVRIEALGDLVTLETTDFDLRVTVAIAGEVETEGHGIASCRALAHLVDHATGGEVAIQSDGKELRFACGGTTSQMRMYDDADWPQGSAIQDPPILLLAKDLQAIELVSSAAAGDDRGILAGVLFDRDLVAATDSYRIGAAKVESPLPTCVIPTRVLRELRRSNVSSCSMAVSPAAVQFVDNVTTWWSRLLEGEYPNVRKSLARAAGSTVVSLVPSELLAAIDRISAFEQKPQVTISPYDVRIEVLTETPEVGEAREVIDGTGLPFALTFSTEYLRPALQALPFGPATIEVTGASKPVIFRQGPTSYLVAPVKPR